MQVDGATGHVGHRRRGGGMGQIASLILVFGIAALTWSPSIVRDGEATARLQEGQQQMEHIPDTRGPIRTPGMKVQVTTEGVETVG